MTLSDKFHRILSGNEDDPKVQGQVAELVFNAPDSPERNGLMSLIYHEGIGVPVDIERSFELAEEAAFQGHDNLGYFMLGYMCDNAETPDQAEGGPRQKYDHYDAERFYEICAKGHSHWSEAAHNWPGDYFMDMARGGDPEEGLEHYAAIAENNAEAAGKLSDYYWNLIMPEYLDDEEWLMELYKWTTVAVKLNPEEYSYRMGWIYADGLGCKVNSDKAIDYFSDAYSYGDWRGAKSIAKMLEESLEERPYTNKNTRAEIEQQMKYWNELGDRLREEELINNLDELDNSIEED